MALTGKVLEGAELLGRMELVKTAAPPELEERAAEAAVVVDPREVTAREALVEPEEIILPARVAAQVELATALLELMAVEAVAALIVRAAETAARAVTCLQSMVQEPEVEAVAAATVVSVVMAEITAAEPVAQAIVPVAPPVVQA